MEEQSMAKRDDVDDKNCDSTDQKKTALVTGGFGMFIYRDVTRAGYHVWSITFGAGGSIRCVMEEGLMPNCCEPMSLPWVRKMVPGHPFVVDHRCPRQLQDRHWVF